MTYRDTASKRITLLDVARAAGVSRATASLVVRQSPLVGQETRAKVETAMRDLGYVYNAGAARLRHGRSRTVGVIFPNLINPFFAEMLAGIESGLDRQDLAVMVANTWESASKQEAFIRRMQQHDVEGIILCAAADTPATVPREARGWPIPVVQALRWISHDGMDYTGTDYADGMRQVVRHLVDLGHERITYVAGDRRHSAYDERLEGFALSETLGCRTDVANIPLTHAHGRAMAADMVDRSDPPSAIACFNDVVALGLLKGLAERGVQVGSDISVVGFDDVPEADLAAPALTTVATRPRVIGEVAAELLLSRLDDPDAPPRQAVEPTKLVVRDSSGPRQKGYGRGSSALTSQTQGI